MTAVMTEELVFSDSVAKIPRRQMKTSELPILYLRRRFTEQQAPTLDSLNWRTDAEFEIQQVLKRGGLLTEVADIPISQFDFQQGALKNDDVRIENLSRAILNGDPIPPLIGTRARSAPPDGLVDVLDGHHRILSVVYKLRPPYPLLRTILVCYRNGNPFHWRDGVEGEALKKAIPSYRTSNSHK